MDQGLPLTFAQRRAIRWWITRQAENPQMTALQLHQQVTEFYSGPRTRAYAHAYVEAVMGFEPLDLVRARDKRS